MPPLLSSVIERLPPFWRNTSTVLFGTVVAQVIPLAVLPVLTRVVPTDQLGTYFVWYGAVTVLVVVANVRLDMAIYTARTDSEVNGLRVAAFLVSLVVGVGAVIIGLGYQAVSGTPLIAGVSAHYEWAWAMCAVAIAGFELSLAVFIYRSQFKRMISAKIVMVAVVAVTQLALSLLGYGASGLIYGQLAVALIVAWELMRRTEANPFRILRHASVAGVWHTLRENYRFPVFAMPADFINTFAAQLPLFIVSARFGVVAVASYALVLRVLATPISLLANSVLAAFKNEAGREFRQDGNCVASYRQVFKTLLLIAIVPFGILFVFGEQLVVWVFGAKWVEAGQFAEILAPMFFMKCVASPLSYTLYIANRQFNDLLWQVVLLTMTWMAFQWAGSLRTAVVVYSFGYTVLYVVYIGMSYSAARGVRAR